MNFFKKFPTVQYDFDRNGIFQSMTDIFRHVKPLENFIDNSLAYRFYEIQDGERPDIVSQNLYGTPNYYWTFFVVNERLHDGYREWPMSSIDFSEYLDKKYGIVTRVSAMQLLVRWSKTRPALQRLMKKKVPEMIAEGNGAFVSRGKKLIRELPK